MHAPTAETILAAWRAGAESVGEHVNPAGPLFVGGDATEADLAGRREAAVISLTPTDSCKPFTLCC